jgi:alkylhydroperoxidase family enzyme
MQPRLNFHKAGPEAVRALQGLTGPRESDRQELRERAALEWTEAVTLVAQTHVPDEVWNRVKPHFTPEELVDLTLLVSTVNAWNRFAISFRNTPV